MDVKMIEKIFFTLELVREIIQDRLDDHLLSGNRGFFDGKIPL